MCRRGERFDPNWYHRYSPLDDEPEDVGADADASKENQGGPNAGPESGSKISEAEEKRAKLGPANQSQAIRSDVSGAMQPASKRLKLAGVWSAADAHCTYTVGPLSPAEVTHSAAHQCAEGLAHTARATGVIKEVQPQAVQRHVLQQSSEVSDLLQQRV